MSLKNKIIENFPSIPEGIDVYLFGSVLNSEEINDIDLAIVYDNKVVDLETAIKIRISIRDKVEEITKLQSDILLLSQEENDEVEFIYNVKNEKINASR